LKIFKSGFVSRQFRDRGVRRIQDLNRLAAMYTLILLLLVVAIIAVIVTAVICRLVKARGRRIRWWLTIFGALGSVPFSLLFLLAPDIYTSDFWAGGQKAPAFVVLVYYFGFGILIALPPAAGVVTYYQMKLKR
jgi:hypothetical protein